MISQHALRRMWTQNEERGDSEEKLAIQNLLAHIAVLEESTNFRYKIAYEVYSMGVGSSWSKRQIVGLSWSEKLATELASRKAKEDKCRYQVGKTHVMRIGDKWHRVNITPYECIVGNVRDAELSPLAKEMEVHPSARPQDLQAVDGLIQQEELDCLTETGNA